MNQQYIQLIVTSACIVAVFVAMKQQRLIDFSPLFALLFAVVSNYAVPALFASGIFEMLVRLAVGYAITRIAAELTKRSSAGGRIQYATQEPIVEFEEVT